MLTKRCNILISTGFHNINYRTNELCACATTICDFDNNLKQIKNMTNPVETIEALKRKKLQEIEDNSTYLLLKKFSPDIKATKSYFFYEKNHCGHRRVFLYYLSRELKVDNNLGFQKYVREVLQW